MTEHYVPPRRRSLAALLGTAGVGAAGGLVLFSDIGSRLEAGVSGLDDPFLGAGIGATITTSALLSGESGGRRPLIGAALGAVIATANKFYKLQFDTHYANLEFLGDLLNNGVLLAATYGVGYGLGAFYRFVKGGERTPPAEPPVELH